MEQHPEIQNPLNSSPIRWHDLDQARAFVRALDSGPSASPYDFDAVPSHITEITHEGIKVVPNPEYETARYELLYYINQPELDRIYEQQTKKEAGKS